MKLYKLACAAALALIAPLINADDAANRAAQTLGKTVGTTAMQSGALAPSNLITNGGAVGASNVWGTSYTGVAPTDLTNQSTQTSLISVGNAAKNASVSGFTQYNGNRADQANQATYFLSRNPVSMPDISPTDPMVTAAHSGLTTPPFNSTTSKNCTEQVTQDSITKKDVYTCLESYIPYIISCLSNAEVGFVSVPGPVIAATISSYSCPPSSGNTVITLSGSNCSSATTTTHSATTNYTCPTGYTRSGTSCYMTTSTTAPATYVGQTCPAGYTYTAGTTNYTCPSGKTLVGTKCSETTTTTSAANVTYSCAAGETLNGTTCSKTTTTTQPPTTTYGCSSGQTLSGTSCISTSTGTATANYACAAGASLVGTNCISSYYVLAQTQKRCVTSATVSLYYSPYFGQDICDVNLPMTQYETDICAIYLTTGGMGVGTDSVLLGAGIRNRDEIACYFTPATSYYCTDGSSPLYGSCAQTSTVAASVSYTCPSGGTVSGSSCISTSTTPATQTNTCSVGFTYNGTTCVKSTTSTSAAIVTYSCPAGATLSGSTCTSSSTVLTDATATTTPATCKLGSTTIATVPSYSCPATATLSGTNCITTTTATTIATVSYSCPSGETLIGTNCSSTTVTTAAATPNYTCPTGYTLDGTSCKGADVDSMNQSKSNGCGPLEGLSQ